MIISKFTVLMVKNLFMLILYASLHLFNGDIQRAEALVCEVANRNGINTTFVYPVCTGPGDRLTKEIANKPSSRPIKSTTVQAADKETQIRDEFTRDRIKVARHYFRPLKPHIPEKDCSITSVGLTPLNDMSASDDYFGENGGLYGSGMNSLPTTDPHWEEARQATLQVQPRNASGQIDNLNGRIGMISIGMSNARYEFGTFMDIAEGEKSDMVVLINGAQPGMVASVWADADQNSDPWKFLAQAISDAGLTPNQVQIVWLKQANAAPQPGDDDFPVYAQELRDDMAVIVKKVKNLYPNVRLVYLSSRIYAGYTQAPLSPEPFAYDGAFSVRWLIEDQINGGGVTDTTYQNSPVLLWGPYLWADGTNPRSDGLVWNCEDFVNDGVHPSDVGRLKAANMLLGFFSQDTLARTWFLSAPFILGLPDVLVDHTSLLPVTIDLWAYAEDAESPDSDLIYTIEGSPPPDTGVTIVDNRWLDINPSTSWCGYIDITVRVTDPGGLWDEDTFRVGVTWTCQGPLPVPDQSDLPGGNLDVKNCNDNLCEFEYLNEPGWSTSLKGYVYLPSGPGPYPAIIISHGKGDNGAGFCVLGRDWLPNFIAICPNYTHAGGGVGGGGPEGGSPENIKRATRSLDILVSSDFMNDPDVNTTVDPSRLYLYGNSMGGFVTIETASSVGARIAAATYTASGLMDPHTPSDPAQAADIEAPFLLLHGQKDATVSPQASQDFANALDSYGKTYNLVWFPNGEHNLIYDPAINGQVFQLINDWFLGAIDPPPTITSTPVTDEYVGVLYTYDVNADGFPAPTFMLTTYPTGMTIDQNTGLIEWTPNAVGDYDVTVLASNSDGIDEQSFTIQVNAITQCPLDMSSYWKLDETSSSFYQDTFGTNDGVCRAAGACPVPAIGGKIIGAQEFSRVSQLGIDIPVPGGGQNAPYDWGQNDSFSIEYWMKRDGPINGSQNSDNEVIIGRDDPGSQLHWWIGMRYDGTAYFQLGDKTGDSVSVSGPAIDDGYWHHLVGVRDAVNGVNYLYVDGVQYSTPKPAYSGGFDSPTAALNLGWLDLDQGYYYSGLLDEVALYNRALTQTEVKSHYYLAQGYCETCATPVDIMPLGDSITVGKSSGVVPDDEGHWISYRKDLWESLNNAGYDVDFVGGESHGYAVLPAFDHEDEGHGGWTDTQIRDTVIAFLTANPADVVLLHIGTNGLDPDPNQVEEILDNIDSVSEDITVLLARIINRRDGSTTTTQFNNNVESMALARMDPTSPSYTADKIIIIDMEDGAGIVYGQAPGSGDMWDNLHPYETGYAKIADTWLHGDNYGSDGLDDFLPVCAPPIPYAPTITSSAITHGTQGWLYSYDVEADGYPAPTFSLTVSPTGMTIDPDTGLIAWTPDSIGDFDVTVLASNSEGSDTQNFTIRVSAPICPVNMISYWRLDETSGPPYLDFFGGQDATCINCPDPVGGLWGGAQNFNGINDEVEVPDADTYEWNSDDSFAVELWMKSTGSCSGNRVMVGRDATDTQLHWWVGCHASNNAAHFGLEDNNGVSHGTTGTTAINDGDWHHIVAVRDASTDQNLIYVDGVLENSLTYNYTGDFTGNATLDIGYLELSGHFRYDGTLDEIAIYGRALSLIEIQDHYNNGLGKTYCEAGLFAPSIESTPETSGRVGDLYTYDVFATGSPIPTYSLTTAPTGMTIELDTGLIEWIPDAVGDFDVTVVASNSEGSHAQSFTIHVRSIGSPTISNLQDQIFDQNNLPPIDPTDLWAYAEDAETPDNELIFTIQGSPPPGAGITLTDNRYLQVNPSFDWCGYIDVTIRVTDPGGLWDEDTLRVAVSWVCQGPIP